MQKEGRQLEFGGAFGTFVANQSKTIEPTTTTPAIPPKDQLSFGGAFALEESKGKVKLLNHPQTVETPTIKAPILPISEKKLKPSSAKALFRKTSWLKLRPTYRQRLAIAGMCRALGIEKPLEGDVSNMWEASYTIGQLEEKLRRKKIQAARISSKLK